MRKANVDTAIKKISVDTEVISGVLEYIQGMPEVKAYNMVSSWRSKLDDTIRTAGDTTTKFEMICNRYIPFQNIVMKLTGVVILISSIGFYLNGSMELLTAIIMMIMSFIVFSGLETIYRYGSALSCPTRASRQVAYVCRRIGFRPRNRLGIRRYRRKATTYPYPNRLAAGTTALQRTPPAASRRRRAEDYRQIFEVKYGIMI